MPDTEPLQGLDGKQLDLTSFSLDTERTSLRPVAMKYAQDIFREFTPAVTRYMIPGSPDRLEQSCDFIRAARDSLAAGTDLQLVILEKDTGVFLGCCGVHARGHADRPELGIWLKESVHGNGYGKEVIRALKLWADANLRYEYLIYPVDRNNRPSCRIPEGLGGTVFREKRVPTQDGRQLDLVVYKIVR